MQLRHRIAYLPLVAIMAATSSLAVHAAASDGPVVYFKDTPQAGVFFAESGKLTAVARNDAGELSVSALSDGLGSKGQRLKADKIVNDPKDVQGPYLGGTVVRQTRSLAITQAIVAQDGLITIKDAGGCTLRGTVVKQQSLWRVSGHYTSDKGCAVAGEAASGNFVAVYRPDLYARLVLAGSLEHKAAAPSAVWIEADRP